MANGDEYKPKNLLSLLPDLAKQEIFDNMGNGYNAMDVITSAVAQLGGPTVTNGLSLLSREDAIEIMHEAEHRGLFPDGAAFATAWKLMELRDDQEIGCRFKTLQC
jgi:hypothetical protein